MFLTTILQNNGSSLSCAARTRRQLTNVDSDEPAARCSSFTLALMSFASRTLLGDSSAIFANAATEFQAEEVVLDAPSVQVDWLSSIEFSNIMYRDGRKQLIAVDAIIKRTISIARSVSTSLK